jgi:hypothetical protein
MDLQQKLVNKMRLRRIQIPVVYQCALLQRFLAKNGVESKVVEGFMSIMGQGSCRHHWVETVDGKQLDIGTVMGMRIAPEMSQFIMKLEHETSAPRVDTDEQSAKIVKDNESLYELLVTDPKKFWTEKPKCLKEFKM